MPELKSNPTVLVAGSSNTDMVIRSGRIPMPGETILGGSFFMNPGGKGANQAVAAARLGATVIFIARVGNDIFGNQAIQHFKQEGINTSAVITDTENPSGIALITVDNTGENTIVVASGANAFLSPADMEIHWHTLESADIILVQLETPIDTVSYIIRTAAALNKKVILNPAPAAPLPEDIYRGLFLITPNEIETAMLTGITLHTEDDCEKAARFLKNKGVQHVIITLGAKGAFVYSDSFNGIVPAEKAQAIDTTAAGDIFNGALAVALAEGKDIADAAAFGCKAAAISVTRAGAQASAPYRREL